MARGRTLIMASWIPPSHSLYSEFHSCKFSPARVIVSFFFFDALDVSMSSLSLWLRLQLFLSMRMVLFPSLSSVILKIRSSSTFAFVRPVQWVSYFTFSQRDHRSFQEQSFYKIDLLICINQLPRVSDQPTYFWNGASPLSVYTFNSSFMNCT